jgi:hypothetical protein
VGFFFLVVRHGDFRDGEKGGLNVPCSIISTVLETSGFIVSFVVTFPSGVCVMSWSCKDESDDEVREEEE